jgi:hypothetical protein
MDLDYFGGVSGCSLVAQALVSSVSGAVPTFSFAKTHYDATFAFQVRTVAELRRPGSLYVLTL